MARFGAAGRKSCEDGSFEFRVSSFKLEADGGQRQFRVPGFEFQVRGGRRGSDGEQADGGER
jgi:hypothetical protein